MLLFERVQIMAKSDETKQKIFEAALGLFRTQGFDSTTMREIAREAGVATGAAYYYYESKDAIVMDFYGRANEEMQPKLAAALDRARSLDDRIRSVIGIKVEQFAPNRTILRALLRNGADPKHPLSPFSEATKEIRDIDIGWFRRVLEGTRVPRDLEAALPGVLWFFQMGVIFFWVVDESPKQARTTALLAAAAKSAASLIRLSGLPLMRPVRKTALNIIALVAGE